MTKIKTLLSALAAIAVATSALAQTTTVPAPAGAGLLGQRFVAVDAFTQDFRKIDLDNSIGGQVSVNLPINSYLDGGLSYDYQRVDDIIDARQQSISGSLRAYTQMGLFNPFVDATLGWTTAKAEAFGFSEEDDSGVYAFGVGVELPLGARTAVAARIGFNDTFESGNNDLWTYSARLNHWFTPRFGAAASITFSENESVTYGLGANLRF